MNGFQKVAAHAFIVRKDKKLLVTHRAFTDDHSPNVHDLPGGSIEFGEVIKVALEREVFEETGLKIETGEPLYVFASLSNSQRHQFQIIYKCNYLGGKVKLKPEEHDSYKWTNLTEAKKLQNIAFLKSFLKETNIDEI